MIIKVNGERDFFLFQDIVYYFFLTLDHRWSFPIESIHEKGSYPYFGASYYIYKSWLDLVDQSVESSEQTDLAKRVLSKWKDWMVTTNIAILTAQKMRKAARFNQYDEEYLRKNKPSFLIELSDDFEVYTIHMDDEMSFVFNEAVSYWESFSDFNSENFFKTLARYFAIKDEVKGLMDVACEHYVATDRGKRYLDTYEVIKEEQA